MPKIVIREFSKKNVDSAIRQVIAYKRTLEQKTEEFINALADIGVDTIQAEMKSIPDEEAGKWDTNVVFDSSKNRVIIRLSGDKVLFVEFSAGVIHGTKEYPLPSGNGFGATSYPNQTHASSPYGWWYYDENGESQHSYGNRAYMPMYKADTAIFMEMERIAKQVFKGMY